MSTSAIGTVLDAIVAGLILRANLAGVKVFSGSVSYEEAELECIAIGTCRLNDTPRAMGGNKLESWEVQGEIRIVKAWAGGTEATIKAARDRALALFAEIETHVNDTYTGEYPHVIMASGDMTPDMGPDGRVCWLQFTLNIQALKNP